MSKKALSILTAVLAVALCAVGVLFTLERSAGAQLSAEFESLSALAEAKDAEIESLTADVEAKQAEIETLTADAEAKAALIASLTADAEARGAELEAKDAALDALAADAEAKDAEIESLTADAEAKDAEIESLTADAEAKEAALQAKAAELDALAADAEAKDATIESLTADAEAKDAEIESLTADAEAKDAALQAKSAELDALAADAEAKGAALEAREAEVAGLNAAIADMQDPEEPAAPEEAFDAVAWFLQRCEAEGLRCEYVGPDSDGDECIHVRQGDLIPYTVRIWISAKSSRVPFMVWQYLQFSAIDRDKLIELCNRLNTQDSDLTFLVDDWDNTISVRGVMALPDRAEGAEADFASFLHLLEVLRENEEVFLPYAQ